MTTTEVTKMTEVTIDPTEKLISRERIESIAREAVGSFYGGEDTIEVRFSPDHAALMSAALAAIDAYQSRLTREDYTNEDSAWVLPGVFGSVARVAVREYKDVWREMVDMFVRGLTYEQVREMAEWAHSFDRTRSAGVPWYVYVDVD